MGETRIAVLSDVHSNLAALEAVLDDLDSRDSAAQVVVTGDCIGYGPDPDACVRLLRERKAMAVMGNHEQALLNLIYLNRMNQFARDALRRNAELLSPDSRKWCESLPKSLVVDGCRFVHGLPPDDPVTYLWKVRTNLAPVFGSFPERICFVGHTHDLARFTFNGTSVAEHPLRQGVVQLEPDLRHLVNIGAVGQPRDGDNRAKYGLFDPGTRELEMRFVAYDIARTAARIREVGIHRMFAQRLW